MKSDSRKYTLQRCFRPNHQRRYTWLVFYPLCYDRIHAVICHKSFGHCYRNTPTCIFRCEYFTVLIKGNQKTTELFAVDEYLSIQGKLAVRKR